METGRGLGLLHWGERGGAETQEQLVMGSWEEAAKEPGQLMTSDPRASGERMQGKETPFPWTRFEATPPGSSNPLVAIHSSPSLGRRRGGKSNSAQLLGPGPTTTLGLGLAPGHDIPIHFMGLDFVHSFFLE